MTRACDVVPGEPLVEELRPTPDVMTALEAVHDWPGVLLLESALVRAPVGRYSFLVADPVASYSLARPVHGQDPFEEIRRALAAYPTRPVTGLPPFQGGAAGLLSYELGQAWERVPSAGHDEFELPPLAVGIYDWVIAWDHADGRAWIVSQGYPECDPVRRTERAATRLSEVRQRLEMRSDRSVEPRPYTVAPALSSSRLASQHPAPGLPGLTSTFTRDGYLTAVERAIEYIAAGDVFQVNLSQRLLHPQSMPSLELYRRLRRCNPAPFAGYFAQDDWAVVSASPERFICVREGEVETRPIKGTRRRSPGPEADLFTRDALRESEKDQAENVMIVDLLRNDLSRVCSPGTIRVPKLCAVETYETVQHLVSEVRGSLRPGEDIWSLIAAAFPGGSITGAPKVRAMEIIAELEPTVRGPYCGSLFYAGFDGQSDSSLLIRTFTCRHGWVQCPVGGGIVAQSHPAAEYLETLHKAEGMLRAFH